MLNTSNQASNGFEKEYCSTGGFQDEKMQDLGLNLVESIDEFNFEQTCLIKLRTQRQKIEQLTKLYEENQKKLLLKVQRQQQLQQENQKLEELEACQKELAEMQNQYQLLVRKQQRTQDELCCTRRETEAVITANSEEIEELRRQLKVQREQRNLTEVHYQGVLQDKIQEHMQQMRRAQERQYELCQTVKDLQEEVATLRELIDEKGGQVKQQEDTIRKEFRSREQERAGFEKASQTMRRQIAQLKATLTVSGQTAQRDAKEKFDLIEQLRMQVKCLRRDQVEKQNDLYEYKEMVKKCDAKNQNLESTVSSLKMTLKKCKVNADCNIKKLQSTTEEERGKLESFINELKDEVQRQVQEKIVMGAEIRKLKGLLQRKDQQERQRKILLMNEFREIDRMQKVVKKIL